MLVFGAIEAGGTKFICGAGTGPDDLQTIEIPTTTPEQTVTTAVAWLRGHAPCAVGIGSFGPVDINPVSPTWGHITSTPKAGWQNFDFAGSVHRALDVPVFFNSDVNSAVLGEAAWGAAQGVSNCLYLTVGTGIGGGAILSGQLLHGASHPEMGHIRIPHDSFPGICPFHGNCLEGLASGPAIEARWGKPAQELPPDHPAWQLEAQYLAAAIANFTCILSPELVLLGGGVMRQSTLFPLIRREVARLVAGYVAVPEIQPPALGQRAGVLGALALTHPVSPGHIW